MRRFRGATAWAAAGFMLAAVFAYGRPPAGSDPNSPVAQWFRSLKVPGTGASCCDMSDCRPTLARRAGQGWEAMSPAGWVVIPPERVLADEAHPGGAAVLCWTPALGVLCFVPPEAGG